MIMRKLRKEASEEEASNSEWRKEEEEVATRSYERAACWSSYDYYGMYWMYYY